MVHINKSYVRISWFIIILSMILLTVLSLPVLAGEGDGSGGGQDNPLNLSSSSPFDGQKDVPLPLLITMTFSKNVINMTVSDNNMKCFSLYSVDGTMVPIDVIMADDQIEPEKKRDIILKPLQDLKCDTAYTVKVSSELKSKSGVTLASDMTISFVTVKGNKTAEPTASDTAEKQNTADLPPAGGKTEMSAGTDEPQAAQVSQGDKKDAGTAGATSPGSSPAASSSDNTTGSEVENRVGESSEQGNVSKSDQIGGGHGTGADTWAAIIAGLALVAAAGHIISRRKK